MTVINRLSRQETGCLLLDCCMLKAVLIPSLLCLSGYIKVHSQCGSWRGVGFRSPKLEGWRQAPRGARCNGGRTADTSANTHCYTAINITQFTGYSIKSTQFTNHSPILPSLPCVPRSLRRNNPTDHFVFAQGRNNPDCLHSIFFICTMGTLCPSTVKILIGQGQPTWQTIADSPGGLSQCASQFLKVPPAHCSQCSLTVHWIIFLSRYMILYIQ